MPLPLVFFVAVVAAGLRLLVAGVGAQTGEAVCLPQNSEPWTNNTRKQSPCSVAAQLQAICLDTPRPVFALPEGQIYIGPRTEEATLCSCSTVVYNLISECTFCQGRTGILQWSQWRTNCTEGFVSVAKWPLAVPNTTAIPAWAFYNPVPSNTFSRTDAALLADRFPDVSATANATLPTSSAASSSSTGPPPNIGAIVGGAVGGVVFLALVILGVLYVLRLLKRRTTELSPSQQYMKDPVYGLDPRAARPQFGGSRGTVPSRARSTVRSPPSQKQSYPSYPPDENLMNYYASNGGLSRDASATAHSAAGAHSINGSYSQLSHTHSQPSSSPRPHHASPVGSIGGLPPWQQHQQQSPYQATQPLYSRAEQASPINTTPQRQQQDQPRRKHNPYSSWAPEM